MTIPANVEKSLLNLIERQNRGLDEVGLKAICDQNIALFGDAGSDERRAVQVYVQNMKRKKARNYVRRLDTYGIPMGTATRFWLDQEARDISPDSSMASGGGGSMGSEEDDSIGQAFQEMLQLEVPHNTQEEPLVGSAAKESPVSSSKTTRKACYNLRSRFSPPNLQHQSTPQRQTPFTNNRFYPSPQTMPTGTPPKENLPFFGNATPPKSLPRTPDGGATLSGYSRGSSPYSQAADSFQSEYPEGSKHNPIIIHVDVEHPERHGRFDVKANPKRVARGVAWETLHIKTAVGGRDIPKWKATMDHSDPQLKDRAIIIQGPSRDSHYTVASDRELDGQVETEITDAEKLIDDAIASDPLRNTTFWKLVLPVGWELNNMVLSSDKTNIDKGQFGVSEMFEDIEFNVLFVEWEIARRDSGRRIAPDEESDSKELKDLFRNSKTKASAKGSRKKW